MTPRHRHGRPKVLLCTPEITELPDAEGNLTEFVRAKSGGLADISAALVKALKEDDRFEVHVALPWYTNIFNTEINQYLGQERKQLIRTLRREGVHLIKKASFDNTTVYDEQQRTSMRRALAFQEGIINTLLPDQTFDIVHCNDWMTGLIPAAAKRAGKKSLFTIHNVFTKHVTLADIDAAEISVTDSQLRAQLYFEKYPAVFEHDWQRNPVDLMASGILAADYVNTVSGTFLQELVEGTHNTIVPKSIRDTLRTKYLTHKAYAILNAPPANLQPHTLHGIEHYTATTDDLLGVRARNKRALQRELGLREDDAPMLIWPSRLYEQKGVSLFLEGLESMVQQGVQIAIVADGDEDIRSYLGNRAMESDGRIAYYEFNDQLNNRGKASADYILMPSLYEPCGLPQMEGPKFGTLTIARATGGLKDTVHELTTDKKNGNGFVFGAYTTDAFLLATQRAREFYDQPPAVREATLRRIMEESTAQFSLETTAHQYIMLYEQMLKEK
jgi:starch synthase